MKNEQVKKMMDEAVNGEYIWEGIKPSPVRSEYRNKMEFSFGDEFKDGPLSLGLHKKGSTYDVLTAGDCQLVHEDMDKILGLEYGADDYITKPFNILEVRARIRTVLRRAGGHVVQEQKIIRVHDMEVNLVKRTVTLGGEEVRLTAKEFDLLQMFITNRGRPFSRKEMLEAVWKYDDYTGDARTVDVHIQRLRGKIGAEYIETV